MNKNINGQGTLQVIAPLQTKNGTSELVQEVDGKFFSHCEVKGSSTLQAHLGFDWKRVCGLVG